jgi:hypothetical protein
MSVAGAARFVTHVPGDGSPERSSGRLRWLNSFTGATELWARL